MKLERPLIRMVIRKYVFLILQINSFFPSFFFFFFLFLLVSSHEYIRGIEKADFAAKSVLDLPCVKDDVTYISQYIISTWLDDWNGAVVNKLHSDTNGPGRLAVLLHAMQEG